MRRSWPWLFVAVALTLALAPRGLAQPGPSGGRDQVIIGTPAEPDVLNPLVAQLVISHSILSTMFTFTVRRDDRWNVFPEGVAYLPTVKDGTWKLDGSKMTLVWKARPRNWQDGKPVTCGDFVFTHNVARNVEVPVVTRDLTNRIANIACPAGAGAMDITVTWKERYPFANLQISEYGALPRQVLEPFYRANPSKLDGSPYGNDPRVTIADGAYRLVEWRRGTSITVESVGTHPIRGTPKIKRITWLFIPDTNALVAAILAGTVDVAEPLPFAEALQVERRAARRFKVIQWEGLGWEHIDFNLDNPLLRDVRVRRAIIHGINRDQMVRQLFDGRQPVSHAYLPPRHYGYTDAVQKYPYDPARARALLTEAGFSPGPDGILQNAAGQRLSFEINTTAGVRFREQIEVIIQEQLRQVGIDITIQNFPGRVLIADLARRKYKAMSFYAWFFSPTTGCDQLYTSDGIPSESNGWAGLNNIGYTNLEMDRVCKGASRELDEARRTRLMNESAQIFARDLPALPLFFRVESVAVKEGLQNIYPSLSIYWNVQNWAWE